MVTEHVAKHPLGVGAGVKLQLRIDGVVLEGKVEGTEDGVGELVVLQPVGASVLGGLVEGGPQQADSDEVVEVAGLERGVLAVVGEAEQLLGGGPELGVSS